jgi:hypothetical protein
MLVRVVVGMDEEDEAVETGGRPPRLRTLMDEFARAEATSDVRGGGRATFVCSGSQRRAAAVVICWAMRSGRGGDGDDALAGAGCAVVACGTGAWGEGVGRRGGRRG